MDPYVAVNKSSLKLKVDGGIEKKKKRKKHLEKIPEKLIKAAEKSTGDEETSKEGKEVAKLTKAQMAFRKMQEKRQMERVMEKAAKTHKQRVEEFNAHLDSLTEHYDIPKVSWTK